MSDCLAQFSCYDRMGNRVHAVGASGTVYLPDFLDWKHIRAKEIYLRRMGGFPPDAYYMLLNSQGETRLVIDLPGTRSNEPVDFKQRKELQNGIEEWVKEECRKCRIDFTSNPRGQ